MDWFLSLYGAEAGNLALKFLSLGGLFIGGGIAPHLIDKFKSGSFLPSFVDKGRFKSLLESIPIWIVLNDDAALLGAAYYAEHYS
jgi:glucokinase